MRALSNSSRLAKLPLRGARAARYKSTAPALKSGTWIDRDLGYDT